MRVEWRARGYTAAVRKERAAERVQAVHDLRPNFLLSHRDRWYDREGGDFDGMTPHGLREQHNHFLSNVERALDAPALRCARMTHPPGAGAFGRTLDIRVHAEPEDGSMEVVCIATAEHVNHNGNVHGGLLMTLLDVAMGGSVVRALQPGERTASVNISTDFLRAVKPGRLLARGRVQRRGRSMAFPIGELLDEEGQIVARASGVWSISAKTA